MIIGKLHLLVESAKGNIVLEGPNNKTIAN